jgi:hypothetical protein
LYAASALSITEEVTWVSKDASVAAIIVSVRLPCPAAVAASAAEAVLWTRWSESIALPIAEANPLPALEPRTAVAGAGAGAEAGGGEDGSGEIGGIKAQAPIASAALYAICALAIIAVFTP